LEREKEKQAASGNINEDTEMRDEEKGQNQERREP